MFAVYPIDTEARCFVRRKCRVAAATPDKYECQYCHRTFAKQYNLLIHERCHHKDENENTLNGLHPCDICGKIFGKAESLKNHRYVTKISSKSNKFRVLSIIILVIGWTLNIF